MSKSSDSYLEQLGDTSLQYWMEFKQGGVPEDPAIGEAKTITACVVDSKILLGELVFRHFGFPVARSFDDIHQKIVSIANVFFFSDWGNRTSQRDEKWIEIVFVYLLSSLLADSDQDMRLVSNWMDNDRSWLPPGSPFDLCNCFLLYKIVNEFRTEPKLDEEKWLARLKEEKSKQVESLWSSLDEIRLGNKNDFTKRFMESIKLYGAAVKKRVAKTKTPRKDSTAMQDNVCVFGSIVWALARRKWPDLEELPVTHAAFVLTKESVA